MVHDAMTHSLCITISISLLRDDDDGYRFYSYQSTIILVLTIASFIFPVNGIVKDRLHYDHSMLAYYYYT